MAKLQAGGKNGGGGNSGGGGNNPPKPPKPPKPDKHSKKFTITVYVYSGGGYNDPSNSSPLPSFDVDIRIKPKEYFSESDIDKLTQNIALNGFIYVDTSTGLRTTYPPNRISHVEAVVVAETD